MSSRYVITRTLRVLALVAILFAGAVATCDASPDPDALAARGFALLADGESERAAACLEAAEALAPDSAIVARDLAVSYARLQRPVEALAKIERAIALGDVDPEAALLRAMLLETCGRKFDAIEAARAQHSAEGDLI